MDFPLIVGNWKMNSSFSESLVLTGSIQKCIEQVKHVNIVLCPPAVLVYPIFDHLKARSKNIYFGLQNIAWEDEGSYTGEISAKMVKGVCDYAIIGHSERRGIFLETEEMVHKKIKYCLKNSITPIVCIGEDERFLLEDHYKAEVKRMSNNGGILDQIEKIVDLIGADQIPKLYFAYEPIWAIGTGNAATGAYVSTISYTIRNYLKFKHKVDDQDIKIIYGGSVDQDNVKEYMLQPNIDGLLVGKSSLKAKDFCKICQITSEVKSGKGL